MQMPLKFSKKKQLCPCGKSRSFHALVGDPKAGKCHSMKCSQRFFPPTSRNMNGGSRR